MINTVQFRMKIEDMRVTHKYRTVRDVLRDFLSDFTSKWATQGSKFAGLARAATAGKKTLVTELSGEVLGRLCMAIRNPDTNTPFGRQMVSDVIPAIDVLRRQFPVSFSTMFSAGALNRLSLPAQIKCHDLHESDRFFDCLNLNYSAKVNVQHLHRRKMSRILETLSRASFLPASLSPTPAHYEQVSPQYIEDESDACDDVEGALPPLDKEFPLVIINTNYNRSHQDNRKFPIKRHYNDKSQAREAGFIWTEKDRKKAMSAIIPKDMATFRKRVKQVLQSGVRNARSHYTKYATSGHEPQRVRINCKDGRNLAFIDSTLDPRLRGQLLNKFMALFPNGVKDTDTEEEGIGNTFPSIHFVWYNRYATRLFIRWSLREMGRQKMSTLMSSIMVKEVA
ncbi:hypothetical protein K443DRAFT_126755 [Laccaria amethystina LaAM-08-1]|uniref:Uncharacterized protein n=1 Tax=Laccaria amethystina LaAM-08-1 TaxID=1095629 RepID=A0A0C9WW90_9AGAR|nr:hypothetical protein K443DRAFT_126755 [Laccaria amethystina LaAM-08-1]